MHAFMFMQAHSMHCISTLFSQLKKHISFQISNENICIPNAPTCQWEKYLLFEPTKGTSISLMIFFLYNHHSLNENYGCINKKCDNTRKNLNMFQTFRRPGPRALPIVTSFLALALFSKVPVVDSPRNLSIGPSATGSNSRYEYNIIYYNTHKQS